MFKTTVTVEGMMCSMCEAHVNEAVRKAFDVKKVESSRAKKQTVIESASPLDTEKVLECINATGYEAKDAKCEEVAEKKGFHLFK